jgi:putative transposase
MSRSGNPYDNALAESFMRTLQCEEVYLKTYRDLDDAALHIQDFLERIYNCERLHSGGKWENGDGLNCAVFRQDQNREN